MDLSGRTILITGAASGIGRATAGLLAEAGAAVGLVDRADAVMETAAALAEAGQSAAAAVADITEPEAVAAAVAEIEAALGPIDGLVNNAGIVDNIAPLDRMTPEAWNLEIGVNLTGAFHMIQAVIGGMKQRGFGRIVNVSSGAARGGLFNQAGYAASKTGLLGLTHNAALEFARHGVTCNAVLPGLIATEKVQAMPAEVIAAAVRATPAKRLGEMRDVANVIGFLLSTEAGFVNGAEIDVSGGLHLNTLALGSRKELAGG